MAWTLRYTPQALKQLRRLDKPVRQLLVTLLENVVAGQAPYNEGKALNGKWARHWRYRSGDYRVICRIHNHELIVEVVRAGHRKDVYR